MSDKIYRIPGVNISGNRNSSETGATNNVRRPTAREDVSRTATEDTQSVTSSDILNTSSSSSRAMQNYDWKEDLLGGGARFEESDDGEASLEDDGPEDLESASTRSFSNRPTASLDEDEDGLVDIELDSSDDREADVDDVTGIAGKSADNLSVGNRRLTSGERIAQLGDGDIEEGRSPADVVYAWSSQLADLNPCSGPAPAAGPDGPAPVDRGQPRPGGIDGADVRHQAVCRGRRSRAHSGLCPGLGAGAGAVDRGRRLCRRSTLDVRPHRIRLPEQRIGHKHIQEHG